MLIWVGFPPRNCSAEKISYTDCDVSRVVINIVDDGLQKLYSLNMAFVV